MTTNLPLRKAGAGEAIEDMMDPRIVSRLAGVTEQVVVVGKDYRAKAQTKAVAA